MSLPTVANRGGDDPCHVDTDFFPAAATGQRRAVGGYLVTRPSNTISDLLGGVTLTLTKADPATSVSVDVATDAGASPTRSASSSTRSTQPSARSAPTRRNTSTGASSVLTGDPMLAACSSG